MTNEVQNTVGNTLSTPVIAGPTEDPIADVARILSTISTEGGAKRRTSVLTEAK